jgi:alkanesulfonate monooxygenase SsuD/methylene tetrahydromethanopterin reductase-like flavin-dependent oxidoreductase (luciferase family)
MWQSEPCQLADLKFGCQLPLEVGDFDRLIEIARECERLGYDSVWAYDHLSPFWTQSGEALECWTTLSAVAACTSKVRVGSLVTNANLRNPSLLAKMSSTVDVISGGRLILGLGTGDRMSRAELHSYGYKFQNLNERVEALRENISILKAMWTKDEASFHGKHYEITRAVNFPKPKQKPHPPIWVGGKHLRILDIVAEMAEGWNYWGLGKEELAERSVYLASKCAKLGRSLDTIVKSWSGTLSRGAKNRAERVEKIAAELRSQTDAETSYFIASFGPRADQESYQAFAEAIKSLA